MLERQLIGEKKEIQDKEEWLKEMHGYVKILMNRGDEIELIEMLLQVIMEVMECENELEEWRMYILNA